MSANAHVLLLIFMMDETKLLEARLPKAGDRLFIQSSWAFDAHIALNPDERFYRLPMGYKRAGDILVEKAIANPIDRSNIIYAAIYCYRHAVELHIKRLIEILDNSKQSKLKSGHDLIKLWKSFLGLFKAHDMSDDSNIEAVQSLVIEMHTADKKSDGFRYPADHGDTPFNLWPTSINLDNLQNTMLNLDDFFESIYFGLSNQLNKATR